MSDLDNPERNTRLFTNGDKQPILFSVTRGDHRERIRKIIEEHGGRVVEPHEKPFLKLTSRNVQHATNDLTSIEFVEECVKQNRLVDPKPFSMERLAERPGAPPKPRKIGRAPFTQMEDAALENLILKNPGASFSGNELYKTFAEEHKSHPWNSWRDRAVKKIIPHLTRAGKFPPKHGSHSDPDVKEEEDNGTNIANRNTTRAKIISHRMASSEGERNPGREEDEEEDLPVHPRAAASPRSPIASKSGRIGRVPSPTAGKRKQTPQGEEHLSKRPKTQSVALKPSSGSNLVRTKTAVPEPPPAKVFKSSRPPRYQQDSDVEANDLEIVGVLDKVAIGPAPSQRAARAADGDGGSEQDYDGDNNNGMHVDLDAESVVNATPTSSEPSMSPLHGRKQGRATGSTLPQLDRGWSGESIEIIETTGSVKGANDRPEETDPEGDDRIVQDSEDEAVPDRPSSPTRTRARPSSQPGRARHHPFTSPVHSPPPADIASRHPRRAATASPRAVFRGSVAMSTPMLTQKATRPVPKDVFLERLDEGEEEDEDLGVLDLAKGTIDDGGNIHRTNNSKRPPNGAIAAHIDNKDLASESNRVKVKSELKVAENKWREESVEELGDGGNGNDTLERDDLDGANEAYESFLMEDSMLDPIGSQLAVPVVSEDGLGQLDARVKRLMKSTGNSRADVMKAMFMTMCYRRKAAAVLEVGLNNVDKLDPSVRRWVFTEAEDAILQSTNQEELAMLEEEKGSAMITLRQMFLAGRSTQLG
ncbi:hypothetical protein DFJ73DRAFT_349548 [Zopfochytrium polystomum]|nr:hypothetical protein DFJ73DRAFT_349548 [Zopfochytrium polystomum]